MSYEIVMRFWHQEFKILKRDVLTWKAIKLNNLRRKHFVLLKIKDNLVISEECLRSIQFVRGDDVERMNNLVNFAVLYNEIQEMKAFIEQGLLIQW